MEIFDFPPAFRQTVCWEGAMFGTLLCHLRWPNMATMDNIFPVASTFDRVHHSANVQCIMHPLSLQRHLSTNKLDKMLVHSVK